jgi:hypothetical protein
VFARVLRLGCCVVAVSAVAVAVAPQASAATLTPGASAYSAAAATGSASLQANLQLTGSLGTLLDSLIDPIVNSALNPLVSALQGTVNDAVSAALGASSSLNVGTDPSQSQVTPAPAAFPNDTLPSPCVASGPQPCYSAATASVNGAPFASIGAGFVSGYAEQVDASADATNPIFGRASVATPTVSVLPGISSLIPGLPNVTNPLVSAGAANSKANCPNDGPAGASKPNTPPSVKISTTGVTLLGGLIKFDVLDGQLVNLWVNGTQYQLNGPKQSGIPELTTLTVSGVTISPYGSSILVSLPLTVDQVLTGLGLPASVTSQLVGLSPTSTVKLSLVVGPNSTITNRAAYAWGLGIGVDLSGSLAFNLFGVVTATVNIPTGIRQSNLGNVLDLRLAYSSCLSGFQPAGQGAPPPIPPALV